MVWQHEVAPVDWRMGAIISPPKKEDLTECSNWRGITLLSVPGKVFAGILCNRIKDAADQLLYQQQAEFRPARSCMDQIFSLKQIVDKGSVILNFVDFCKAFDNVHKPALWKILELYGIPSMIISITQKHMRKTAMWSELMGILASGSQY